jgi:glycolate oxidase iron-sulfur subunit
MADLHELARLLKDLDDQMAACMKCGMCQAACPLYAETGRETDVARGKIALVENLASEMLKDPKGVKERLDRCLLCGSCAASCPSGVRVLDIFLKARAILAGYLGLSPAKKAIFRGMLARPRLMDTLLASASKFQGVFAKPVNEALGSSCARFMSPLLGDRHFVPLAKKPWHKEHPAMDTPRGRSGLKVAFYPGCLVDRIFPRIARDVVKVMEHHGVGMFMPTNQVCCGIPALSSGDLATFQNLVQKNVDIFANQDLDVLITPCATCTSTIKKIWPLMAESFSRPVQNRIHVLAEKTMDVNAFLVDKLRIGPVEANGQERVRVTYHDPCHLRKSLDVINQPRLLLQANPACDVLEMKDPDRCCGMGGSFNLLHYDLSKQVGDKKRQAILDANPDVVCTGCPACMMQITDLLSHANQDILVKHPVELYAQTLGSASELQSE